jgi:hypothetical protein
VGEEIKARGKIINAYIMLTGRFKGRYRLKYVKVDCRFI